MSARGPVGLTHTDRPVKRRRTAAASVAPRRAERGISRELTAESHGLFGKPSFTRLLLVEDNPGDARLLSEMLNEPGADKIELMHRETMSQAEKHLALGEVDVVLLDLGLPDAEGLGAVRRARAAAPGVPLVVLTGLDDEPLASQALREGAQDYLVKGQIDARELVRAVRHAIERKAAESHLAEVEARYRRLLEAAPDAMVVVNGAGEIVLLNLQAEKQFGYHRDELVGQKVTSIIPTGFAERIIADDLRSAADALAQQIGTGIELVALRKDGTQFPIELMLSPLEGSEGILVTAAIRDISVRKVTASQLLQMEKLESVGRLAGGIAHDFNNMLFVIQGYAELLTDDLAVTNRTRFDPASSLLNVNEISRAAERAAALTAQLLAFSRQQMIVLGVLDLNAAVLGLERMVRQLIGENMRLIVQLDPAAGHIRGDAGQLDQILVNLVVNARDAMPDGGTVTIETSNTVVDEPYAISHFDVRPGPYVLLSVTDTGMGMDPSTREHIFEPFFTTKGLGKGTGLGLATTYGIVRQAGGHIWVYSEPGLGSSFKLFFPRVDAPTTTEQRPVPSTIPVSTGTVLVVEDERLVRDMTTLLLTRSGYTVVAVADAAEAMTRLASVDEPIDALVTDVIMPKMSGIELAHWTMDRYPRVGVVLLSGYTAETLNIEQVTARGATFVAKPVTTAQLLLAVQQARFVACGGEEVDQPGPTPRD